MANPASTDTHRTSFVAAINSTKGTPLLGTVLTLPSTTIAQTASLSPHNDFIMIDMEHSPLSPPIVCQMVSAYAQTAALSSRPKFPIVRIPSHGVEWIKWALDSGAAGIIIPMVSNVDEMKAILDRALYPPDGRRSFGPLFAPFASAQGAEGGMGAYFANAKKPDQVAILPMIENAEGVLNAEAILSLPGVSGTFVGPADLSLSLGLPPAVDSEEKVWTEAMAKVARAAKKCGKVVGTMGMGEAVAKKRASEGYDFLLSTFDYGAMSAGLARELEAAKKGVDAAAAKL